MLTSPPVSRHDRSVVKYSSSLAQNERVAAYSDGLVRLVKLLSRLFVAALLVVLLGLSFISWLWIASFRKGWQLWDWFLEAKNGETPKTDEQIAYSLLYGAIIFIASPVILFSDWSQRRLLQWVPDWMTSSVDVSTRQIIEDRLGIRLGDAFPSLGTPIANEASSSQRASDK